MAGRLVGVGQREAASRDRLGLERKVDQRLVLLGAGDRADAKRLGVAAGQHDPLAAAGADEAAGAPVRLTRSMRAVSVRRQGHPRRRWRAVKSHAAARFDSIGPGSATTSKPWSSRLPRCDAAISSSKHGRDVVSSRQTRRDRARRLTRRSGSASGAWKPRAPSALQPARQPASAPAGVGAGVSRPGRRRRTRRHGDRRRARGASSSVARRHVAAVEQLVVRLVVVRHQAAIAGGDARGVRHVGEVVRASGRHAGRRRRSA